MFFVEKSELEWKEGSGKYLTLSRSLSPGSMIFLRLLQPTSRERPLSVAYRAQRIGVTLNGQQKFKLQQVQPNCDLIDKEKSAERRRLTVNSSLEGGAGVQGKSVCTSC